MHGHTCKQQGRFSEIIIVRAVLRLNLANRPVRRTGRTGDQPLGMAYQLALAGGDEPGRIVTR